MAFGIYVGDTGGSEVWRNAFRSLLPGWDVREFPDWSPCEEIEYALVWHVPPDLIARCVNLKAIFSMGAGVEHLTDIRSALPKGVPIVRMADPALVDCMTEYVVMNVLMHHRDVLDYQELQRESHWKPLPPVLARNRRIGFMGFGNMAQKAAGILTGMGFDTAAWTRTGRDEGTIPTYAGGDTLPAFLGRTDILVCLLPATASTEGLLNSTTLAMLPRGSAVINSGRGSLVIEPDLIEALDSGHLRGASLDVFSDEPLPADSPLWSHPRILITPHMASPSIAESASQYVVDVINQLQNGEVPEYIVDLSRGY
jgi:glyoxylate/hydroxypyruvate reductase A